MNVHDEQHDEQCDTQTNATNNTIAATSNNETPPPTKPRRVYKPIKRKRGVLSSSKRGGDRKRSSYDYEAAYETLGIDSPARGGQQIVSALMHAKASTKPPPPPPSPNKTAVKRQVKNLKSTVKSLKKSDAAKDKKMASKDKKIATQDLNIRDLLQQLRLEKKTSNTIMNDTMSKAVEAMDEAVQLREKAKVYEKRSRG